MITASYAAPAPTEPPTTTTEPPTDTTAPTVPGDTTDDDRTRCDHDDGCAGSGADHHHRPRCPAAGRRWRHRERLADRHDAGDRADR